MEWEYKWEGAGRCRELFKGTESEAVEAKGK
jgi:hypothetical protein